MDTLQILLLGPPAVMWGDKPLQITRRSLRAILFYLACKGQVSRSELVDLFWPNQTAENGRRNLRTALARLRSELPNPDLLEVTPDHASLKSLQVRVDLHQFLDLAQPALRIAGQVPESSPLPERVAQKMREAACLWRSPRFLAGFSLAEDSLGLDEWFTTTSQQSEGTYLRVLTRLADHSAASGDLDSALSWAQSALEVDPWAAELHERILRWLTNLNRTSGALSYAQSLIDRYKAEGEDMPPSLESLIHKITQVAAEGPRPTDVVWPGYLQVRTRLVGRRGELGLLRAAYQRGGMAVLWGEAGLGKTRLAYELHRGLEPRPRLLLFNAIHNENSLPFQPLIDALRRTIHQEEWERLPRSWLSSLAYLLPELAEAQHPNSDLIPFDILRSRVFEAFRQLLLEVSQNGRWLLILDNAQWCDESTLAALSYLVERRFFSERALLLVSARPEEVAPALDAFVLKQRGQIPTQQINLTPLEEAETAELAQIVLGQPLDTAQVRHLAEETGGNPLFLLETLYALLDHAPGNLLSYAFEKLPIGGSLHNLLSERLERLHPLARQVAAAAAVIGAEFTPALLEAATQFSPESIAAALEELEHAHIIEPAIGSAPTTYTFIHGQVREVIRWKQGPARQRLLHLRTARALEAQSADTNRLAASLAQHYEAAGELFIAVLYWLKAGDYARSRLSTAEAELAYQSAERLAQRLTNPLPEENLHQLYTGWGAIAMERGDLSRMEQVYSRLQKVGEQRQSSLLLGSAFSGLAELSSLKGDPNQALDFFRRAEYHLQNSSSPTEMILFYDRLAWHLLRLARYREAIELLEKAISLAAETQDESAQKARVMVEFHLGIALSSIGSLHRAVEVATESLRRSHPPAAMYAHLILAGTKYYQGEFLVSLEHNGLGLQIAEGWQSPRMSGYFYMHQNRAELELGELDAAWKHLETAIRFAQANHFSDFLADQYCTLGDLYLYLEDPSSAIQFYQRGIQVGEGKWDSLLCQAHLAMALVEDGKVAAGLREVEEALNRAIQMDMGVVAIPTMAIRAQLLAQTGQLTEALEVMEEWRSRHREHGFFMPQMVDAWVQAQAAIPRSDRVELFRQAHFLISCAKKAGSVWWELRGYQVLRQLGPLDPSSSRRVSELFDHIDHHARHPDLRVRVEAFIKKLRSQLLPR